MEKAARTQPLSFCFAVQFLWTELSTSLSLGLGTSCQTSVAGAKTVGDTLCGLETIQMTRGFIKFYRTPQYSE